MATVSNVLNAPERVAADTRQRVADAIDQLGYRPNRAARSLPQGRTFTIGYCIPDGKERFALDTFLHQLTERASESDMDILIFTPHRGQSEADSYREIVRRGAVDGFIVSSTVHDDERVQVLLDAGTPVVSFGRTDLSAFHSWVDVDGRAGTRAATEHLVSQGHRRLALVAWPAGSITGDERAAGFHEGLEGAGIEVDTRYVIRVENEVESGREAAAQLLDLDSAPTAIVAVQDVLAAGVVAELNARGIRGGKDIAVTGFDDSPPAVYSTPSITSVRQPIEAIGRRVVEFLMHDLEGSDGIPGSALVEPELVIRESSTGWDPA